MKVAVLYEPFAVAETEPLQTGVPPQAIAEVLGNGPNRSTTAVTDVPASEPTVTRSKIGVLGETVAALAAVESVGWAWTKNRSVESEHEVRTPMLALSPGTRSWKPYHPGRFTAASGLVYVPGPCVVKLPVHAGLPQATAALEGNGPSTVTVTFAVQPAVAPLIVT